jgi:hypothetical protein
MMINRLLAVDAATCVLMGAGLLVATDGLAALLHLPHGLLFWSGLALLPIALFMAVLALQPRPSSAGVWLVVFGNAAWVAGSLLVILVSRPNGLGVGFILLQGGVVAILTLLELNAMPSRYRGRAIEGGR